MQKGCGQRLLAKAGTDSACLWVLLEGRDASLYPLNCEVQIGVPEDVILKASWWLTMVPLLLMLAVTLAAHTAMLSDGSTAVCALLALFMGGALVRWRFTSPNDNRLHPVLIDEQQVPRSLEICALES
jgi:sigma-E factor negative regulatory protein RseC